MNVREIRGDWTLLIRDNEINKTNSSRTIEWHQVNKVWLVTCVPPGHTRCSNYIPMYLIEPNVINDILLYIGCGLLGYTVYGFPDPALRLQGVFFVSCTSGEARRHGSKIMHSFWGIQCMNSWPCLEIGRGVLPQLNNVQTGVYNWNIQLYTLCLTSP